MAARARLSRSWADPFSSWVIALAIGPLCPIACCEGIASRRPRVVVLTCMTLRRAVYSACPASVTGSLLADGPEDSRMKRLLPIGAVLGLALGAGPAAQNAQGPATAPRKTPAPAGAPANANGNAKDWPTVGNDP